MLLSMGCEVDVLAVLRNVGGGVVEFLAVVRVMMEFLLCDCIPRCVHSGRGEDANGWVERLSVQPVGHQVGVYCDSRYVRLINRMFADDVNANCIELNI